MTAPVFFAVLFAALLHAGWNAWVKGGRDGFTAILLLALGQSLIAAALLALIIWLVALIQHRQFVAARRRPEKLRL